MQNSNFIQPPTIILDAKTKVIYRSPSPTETERPRSQQVNHRNLGKRVNNTEQVVRDQKIIRNALTQKGLVNQHHGRSGDRARVESAQLGKSTDLFHQGMLLVEDFQDDDADENDFD